MWLLERGSLLRTGFSPTSTRKVHHKQKNYPGKLSPKHFSLEGKKKKWTGDFQSVWGTTVLWATDIGFSKVAISGFDAHGLLSFLSRLAFPGSKPASDQNVLITNITKMATIYPLV